MTKELILLLDTETANSIEEPIPYNIGGQIVDTEGNVYERFSFLVKEIFLDEKELMTSAYYADKIPLYWAQVWNKEIKIATFQQIWMHIRRIMRKYNCHTVCAHNASFDMRALNTIQRWETKSKYRYFFPYGTKVMDTMIMARDVLASEPSYISFCEENGFMTNHSVPRPRLTAEVIYRYLTNDTTFEEEHRAFEDVKIETEILKYCFAKGVPMRTYLY